MTEAEFFECFFELFNVITKDYRGAFKRSSVSKRDQGLFFSGQKLDFLYRLLRRSVAACLRLRNGKHCVVLNFLLLIFWMCLHLWKK